MVDVKKDVTVEEIKALGFKSGLEIHQQLEGRKLFCNSPTLIRDDEPDFTVKRYLRASAGESGVIDAAALAEMKKKKYNLYQGYYDTISLVELDEEPPGDVNGDALTAGLQIAKIFSMDIIDQIRFMRKVVVDGSNTSGFQRTGLLATNGSFTVNDLQITVESLCLEEDSCKKVESRVDAEVYNLSRLGIPLLEIATGPDMKTPEEVAQVAEYIGMVLRSLPNVKRGLGTIRQDVNVSIKEGVRVEIKGAQDLKMIPTLGKYEALRQHNMLKIFEELKKRHASVGDVTNVTTLFTNTKGKVIRSALDNKGAVLALPLHKFAGITGLETQPGRRYGSELSDHAKVMGVKGLFHADELPKYGITQEEKEAVYKTLNLSSEDNFLLIAADEVVARRALTAAKERAQDFALHSEVRQALPDGTTAYMRPMPGAARMYPETDVKPVYANKDVSVPKLLTEQIKEISSTYGVTEDIAKRLLRDGIDIGRLTSTYAHLKVGFIVDFFYATPGLVKKKYGVDATMSTYEFLLEKIDSDSITKDALPEIIGKLAKGESVDYTKYEPVSASAIEDVVKKVVSENSSAPMGALMGMVMKELGGKADGKTVMELLKKLKN